MSAADEREVMSLVAAAQDVLGSTPATVQSELIDLILGLHKESEGYDLYVSDGITAKSCTACKTTMWPCDTATAARALKATTPTDPDVVERVADAIVRAQSARLDGFEVGLDDLSDGREDALNDARAAIAAIGGTS